MEREGHQGEKRDILLSGIPAGMEVLLSSRLKHQGRSETSIRGFATDFGRFSSSTGNAAERCTGRFSRWVRPMSWPLWRQGESKAGGITVSRLSTRCSQSLISTAWVCSGSFNLNFSNRPVRPRTPGGVGRGNPLSRFSEVVVHLEQPSR